MRPLHQFPGLVLGGAFGRLFFRQPADGRGIEKNLRALQGRQAGRLGKPLIPADERADAHAGRVEHAEAQITGREIVLFLKKRVVRDVHFTVFAQVTLLRVEDGQRVVVESVGAFLEQTGQDRDVQFGGQPGQLFGGRARHRLGQLKVARVFVFAEVGRAKQLGQADDPGAWRTASRMPATACSRFRAGSSPQRI